MKTKYKIGQWFFDFNYNGVDEEFTISRNKVTRIVIEKTANEEVWRYYDMHNCEIRPRELYESLPKLKRSILNSINSLIKQHKKSLDQEAQDEQG